MADALGSGPSGSNPSPPFCPVIAGDGAQREGALPIPAPPAKSG